MANSGIGLEDDGREFRDIHVISDGLDLGLEHDIIQLNAI